MLIVAQRYRCENALFLLLVFSIFLVGCNYYQVKTRYQGDEGLHREAK